MGGGILCFITLTNLNAVELSQICTSGQLCKINTPQSKITNSIIYTTDSTSTKSNNKGQEGIYIETTIGTFTNYGDIVIGSGNQAFTFQKDGYIGHFINYGKVGVSANGGKMSFWSGNQSDNGNVQGISHLTNYGTMGAIDCEKCENTMTLNNLGTIGQFNSFNIKGKFMIENYALKVSENAETFNKSASGLSHLVVSSSNGQVSFKDGDSKIILDFDKGFEFGKGYSLNKLVVDTSGNNKLNVDLSHLTTKSSLYRLTQHGDSFIVSLDAPNSEIGILYKSNIRTMNNFLTISNSMIYPHKNHKSQNLRNSSLRDLPTANRGNPLALSSLRADSQNLRGNPPIKESVDSANPLKSYESFAYQNESPNLQTRRIQRQKRNYSRNQNNSSLRASASERGNLPQNLAQSDNYYFILTPFINHNYFFQSGRYNLSGFDYGFLTAFSARVAESNSLGAHFMMSYGTLSDSIDKNFHISNLNLNLGVNYKLDLVWDMYLKARGDFFYFLNQVKTLTMREAIKPNNLGFGASVSYGKDFDFKQGGVLGIEGGIDYKALSASEITLDSMSETYKKSLYHLLYLDLGISYIKYFGNFGINANLGIKGNITANKLAKSKISLNTFNRSVDMILDNDKILGYANVALSYVLNHRNFDMEFSLAYYGNFGDRIISNGGGFEWRVGW